MKDNQILSATGSAGTPLRFKTSPSYRILLVDDDLYVRELSAGVLIRFGYQVDTAEDGADAWKVLNEVSYDLLITDNKMPRVTGLELIKKLRSQDMTLPIILVSGTVPTEELKRHPWLQLDATLPKPFTIDELLDTVTKVLRAADNTRIRVETDFPAIIGAISQIESESPPRYKSQPTALMKNSEITSLEEPATASIRDQTNPSYRILVVDDNSDTRQLSVDVLAGSGYDAEAVKDGAAGWEALQANNYDLVITDNKMPRMTGVEMIEKLRYARMAVPVIMATGNLPVFEFARKPWLRPDAALERPFSNDDLLATVRKVLHTDDGSDGRKETLLPMYL
jgi:DNA-binding response OmpR family regulator